MRGSGHTESLTEFDRLRVTEAVDSQRFTGCGMPLFSFEMGLSEAGLGSVHNLIGERDIRRARESAAALRKLYSQETVPLVYGYRIADQQRRSAQAGEELEEVLVFLENTAS